MKVVAILRTRNEEENIQAFCENYQWVDQILIADGESSDKTVEIASRFSNVKVKTYSVFVEMENGYKRTPHGSHLNFLIDWATIEEKADWVIQDDADCLPNKYVKQDARGIFETTEKDYVYITRLYLWLNQGHFPKLAKPVNNTWTPSIWAWRTSTGLRFRADRVARGESHQELIFIPKDDKIENLLPPYALLHRPWQTSEAVERKLKFYRESGQIKNMEHPIKFGGNIEPLPEWAVL